MPSKCKTPAGLAGRGVEKLGGFHDPFTLAAYRAQHIAARYALPTQSAARLALHVFGGACHG